MKPIASIFRVSLIVAVLLFSLNSCDCIRGEGPLVSENRDIKNFDGIELNMSADVFVTKSDDFKFKIEAQENVLDHVETYVKGGLLRIRYEDHCVITHRGVKIYISMPELNEIQVGGSGEVISDDTFESKRMLFKVGGSGAIELNTNAKYIECSVNGSGGIDLSGSADEMDVFIRGSGDVDAIHSKVKDVYVKISGSGKTRVHAIERLNVDISGSGDVLYRGKPDIKSDINGSGDLKKIR